MSLCSVSKYLLYEKNCSTKIVWTRIVGMVQKMSNILFVTYGIREQNV